MIKKINDLKKMKLVILAGGYGTRISEETDIRPKPMIEIGGYPIIWHIMKYYSSFGITNFIICCGYKGYIIKEYFSNYYLHTSDVSIDLKKNSFTYSNSTAENWKISLIDTGSDTMTGGRLARIKKNIGSDENFFMTYGDGLSNVDINKLFKFHIKHKKIASLTAVKPEGRFGAVKIQDQHVRSFSEKDVSNVNFINGGFFTLNSNIFNYICGDNTIFEKDTLVKLTNNKQLMAFEHRGFWHPMDTLRDKNYLQHLWDTSNSPWKIW